jgi:hypothetical protein
MKALDAIEELLLNGRVPYPDPEQAFRFFLALVKSCFTRVKLATLSY